MRKSISKGLRFDVFSRDNFRCRYCGIPAEYTVLHIDHVVPVVMGGTNDFDNLVTACISCNLGKSAKLVEIEGALEFDGIDCPFADGWPNDIENPVFFMNKIWAVTRYGMERLNGFYPIEADTLGHSTVEDKRLGNWLSHLVNKTWAFPEFDLTIVAFQRAIEAHGVNIDFDMNYTLQIVRARRDELAAYQKAAHLQMNPNWFSSDQQ